jgi:polysaccharide pyruvyl transferase CsaB
MPPAEPAASRPPDGGVVIAGWSGTENLGDELLLRALLGMLADRGLGATVVSRRPEVTRAVHGVHAIGLSDAAGLVAALRRSRGMVLGPGGILQDQTSPASLPWHLARVGEARAIRRPVVGVGLGAGPLARRGSRTLVGLALRRCQVVAVRDEPSAALLAGCGVDRVAVGVDLVLGLDAPRAAPEDRIVVCLRPHTPGGSIRPLRRLTAQDLDPARVRSIAGALDRLAADVGLPLHLVAMERGRDDHYHQLVADRLTAPVTTAVPDLDGVLEEVARSRLVVAMRYHAGVAALLAGRPAVLVGYAPKVRALAGQVGEPMALVADDPTGHAAIPAAVASSAFGGGGGSERTAEAVHAALIRMRPGLAAHHHALDLLLG